MKRMLSVILSLTALLLLGGCQAINPAEFSSIIPYLQESAKPDLKEEESPAEESPSAAVSAPAPMVAPPERVSVGSPSTAAPKSTPPAKPSAPAPRSASPSGRQKIINIPHICQIKDYPTGCESVSTVMALKYAGVNISIDRFVDSYLEIGDYSNFHPNVCFGGDPRGRGMGCYSPVIKRACDKLLSGTDYSATELKGESIEFLCSNYIDRGIPVIFWGTMSMSRAYDGVKYTYNGTTYTWIAPEHCLLLVGYNDGYYIFNDPLKEAPLTYYPKSRVKAAYTALGKQAVVIEKREHNYIPDITPPDCENIGFTTHTCSYCGDSFTDSVTPAIGHNLLSGIETEPAGYLKPATTESKCSECFKSFSQYVGFALCDFNLDGEVNEADYAHLVSGAAEIADISHFDFNKNGSLDESDKEIILLLINGTEPSEIPDLGGF